MGATLHSSHISETLFYQWPFFSTLSPLDFPPWCAWVPSNSYRIKGLHRMLVFIWLSTTKIRSATHLDVITLPQLPPLYSYEHLHWGLFFYSTHLHPHHVTSNLFDSQVSWLFLNLHFTEFHEAFNTIGHFFSWHLLYCVQSCLTLCGPITLARLTPVPMEFSRQEYWSGVPFPTPGDVLDPGIEPVSLASPALAGRFFTTSTTWESWHL